MTAMATEKKTMALDYTDRDETGRWYTVEQAQVGWLLAERLGPWPSGDLRLGVITAVHGGGFTYVDDHGNTRFVADRRVYAVARPTGEAQEG